MSAPQFTPTHQLRSELMPTDREKLVWTAREELRTFDRVSRATAIKLLACVETLASSTPAEPREASGYCPFCMTADPVAPAEGDEPGERKC